MRSASLCLLPALMLTGCSLAPDYAPPVTAAPAAYKEIPAGWTTATPLDAAPRGAWWTMFGDPMLDGLEARIESASPTLAAAVARYDAARASAGEASADLYPTVGVSGDAVRERTSGRRPGATRSATYTDATIGGSLAYEIDLWGRVRNSVRAADASAEASAADLQSVRLSLQASVADAYFRLRGLDAEAALLRKTVEAFGRALELTQARHDGGAASGLDVSRAQTQLSDARAQISDVANRRAATEHEIAALVGLLPSELSLPPSDAGIGAPPPMPIDTPASLVQRRPDVAAAERRIAAANARIGVARAAFFPSLTLGGTAGFEAAQGSLLSSPASFWALGPLTAALDLFDGGRRRARVRISRAEYDEAAANYREAVLTAFRETEDQLAAARLLAAQARDQRDAAAAARRTSDLAFTRYREGASDYLDVVTAQTAALDAQRAEIAVQTLRVRTAVALVRALGGSSTG
ncbi:efflux transporter outer membrane subunit [Sphingomonas tabacisoli]|uniref:Efflux transporter outer membrane subunit n=1 Tax=Sphingomonas tabacisoli TaxID=2249466 RepID=A0ABW4I279_9SPHN